MSKEKSVWDLNPELKAYHQTSDNNKFFSADAAKTHARSLKDKTVEEVKRPVGEKAKSKDSDTVKASKNALTPMQEAQNRVKAISKLTTVEEVNKALEGEKANSVIEAGKAQISVIEKAGGKKDYELRAEAITKLETVEAVNAALKDETSKTVIKAGEERIKAIEAAAKDAK